MDKITIFYSWQSENKTIKNYITDTLAGVVNYINDNSGKEFTVEVDKDTAKKLGSPNIPKTIEEKIDSCDIYIADMSIVGEIKQKKLINQNVMYETGYAIARKGDSHCILLQNSDDCIPNELPFDIAQRRLLIYSGKDKNLKQKLLEILPIYVENARLMRKSHLNEEADIKGWSIDILNLFKSIEGEKRIIVSKAGCIRINVFGLYNDDIYKKLTSHQDPQEIRAAIRDLVEKDYLEEFFGSSGTPNYRLLQKGYDYINGK